MQSFTYISHAIGNAKPMTSFVYQDDINKAQANLFSQQLTIVSALSHDFEMFILECMLHIVLVSASVVRALPEMTFAIYPTHTWNIPSSLLLLHISHMIHTLFR